MKKIIRKGGVNMQLKAVVFIIGKRISIYKDKEGVEHTTYIVNISQNNGEIIEMLRLNQQQYDKIEANKMYSILCEYATSKNGNYLKIVDIIDNK